MMIYNSVFWILMHVLLQFFTLVPGEVQYGLEFTDSILSCSDFENENIKSDMKMGLTEGKDGEPDTFGMNGELNLFVDVDSDHDIQIEVFKETEVGSDPVLGASMKTCDSIKDKDAPWHPVFEKMNVSTCPIAKGTYEIKNLVLSMEPFKGCLSREFCGYYTVQLKIVNKLETVSCHMAYIEIVEKQSE